MPIGLAGLSQHQIQTIADWVTGLSIASIIGSAFVVLTYLSFERKRTYPANFTLFFALSSLGLSISTLPHLTWVQTNNHEISCLMQSMGIQYFGWAAVLWWFLVSVNLYAVVVKHQSQEHHVLLYHLVGWGIPLLFSIPPAWADKYAPSGLWCWIDDPIWEFCSYYGEMGVLLLLGTLLWIQIIRYSLKDSRLQDPTASLSRYARHVLFVATFFLVFSLMFIHRLWEAMHPKENQSFSLLFAHAIAVCSQGIIVFVVFGVTNDNLNSWINLVRGQFGYEPIGG